MKLQHITVCLNKGAQAVPASFLGSIAWACKELRCVHPVLVTCWKLVSFGRLFGSALRQADSLAFSGSSGSGLSFGRLSGLACGRLIP